MRLSIFGMIRLLFELLASTGSIDRMGCRIAGNSRVAQLDSEHAVWQGLAGPHDMEVTCSCGIKFTYVSIVCGMQSPDEDSSLVIRWLQRSDRAVLMRASSRIVS